MKKTQNYTNDEKLENNHESQFINKTNHKKFRNLRTLVLEHSINFALEVLKYQVHSNIWRKLYT